MTDMNRLLQEAANRGRVLLNHREAAVPAADRLKEDALRADAEKPIASMNELLRAAAGHITPEQRAAILEARDESPPPPSSGSADGGVRGVAPEHRPSSGQLINAVLTDAAWSRRYGRPRVSTVGELRYTGLLDDDDAA
ncbi:MAG: hypothetical protein ACR2I5_05780 [Candidatus Limnocylindria bacterium]